MLIVIEALNKQAKDKTLLEIFESENIRTKLLNVSFSEITKQIIQLFKDKDLHFIKKTVLLTKPENTKDLDDNMLLKTSDLSNITKWTRFIV